MIKNDFNMIYVITKKRNPLTLIEKKECWSTLRRRKWRVFRMKPNFGYNFIYENSSMKILFVLLSFRKNGKKKIRVSFTIIKRGWNLVFLLKVYFIYYCSSIRLFYSLVSIRMSRRLDLKERNFIDSRKILNSIKGG